MKLSTIGKGGGLFSGGAIITNKTLTEADLNKFFTITAGVVITLPKPQDIKSRLGETITLICATDSAVTLAVASGVTIDGQAAPFTLLRGIPVRLLASSNTSWALECVHPVTHPASIIVQDASNRFMTDAERAKLGGIQAFAQVNADITKSEIEARLTGELTSHSHLSNLPVGAVIYYPKTSAPTGFLKANGAAVSRTTYAALFDSIGTTFGTGDGSTTFNIPDLRGEFIRGWDDSRGVDSSRVFGSEQSDLLASHRHTYERRTYGTVARVQSGTSNDRYDAADETLASSYTGGTETRPRNVALLACIKY